MLKGTLPWYVARSSGLVAWGLLAAAVVWGLLMTSKVLRGRVKNSWLLDLHRWLGGLALTFTGVHVLAIMGDSYVHFGLASVLVPLAGHVASRRRRVGRRLALPAGRGRADVARPQAPRPPPVEAGAHAQLPAVRVQHPPRPDGRVRRPQADVRHRRCGRRHRRRHPRRRPAPGAGRAVEGRSSPGRRAARRPPLGEQREVRARREPVGASAR